MTEVRGADGLTLQEAIAQAHARKGATTATKSDQPKGLLKALTAWQSFSTGKKIGAVVTALTALYAVNVLAKNGAFDEACTMHPGATNCVGKYPEQFDFKPSFIP